MSTSSRASLDAVERRVLERLLDVLDAELGEELRAVWLYGSRARGEAGGPESDVDLLVITRGGRGRHLPGVTRLVARAAEAEGADPGRFAAHVWAPDVIESRRRIDSFFMREVDRDKIVLFERP